MNQIELTITAQSPLAIGRHKSGGSVSEAEDYIPGMVIRGAMAAHILQQSGQNSTSLMENGGDFQSLFLSETPAIFQNAYPAIATVAKEDSVDLQKSVLIAQCVEEKVYILPATAVSAKDEPGFKWEQDKEKLPGMQKGGVFDTLIDRFCAQAYHQTYDPSCPKDSGRVEPLSGFYSKTNASGIKYPYRSHGVSTRFLTRVGINRRRATAEDSILYSTEVLNESFLQAKRPLPDWQPTVFRGSVLVADSDLAEMLKQYINASDYFRIGGSASRGLGKVKIKADKKNASNDLEMRLKMFNDVLAERWKLWNIFGEPAQDFLTGRTFFTLGLQSDAVLNENWQYTTVISEEMLCHFANLSDDLLKLEAAYSSYDYRSGWNAAWGLKKDMELITNKGSVYLFSIDTARKTDWLNALTKLELTGVGERTPEGFGQIQVCDEFHLIFREEAV
jgi:CRISPR-associated protein Csx10